MIKENFVGMFESSFKDHWHLPAITNYDNGKSYSYAEYAQQMAKVHLMLEYLGVQKGEKVALIARDSAEWCIVWLGVVTYGAVIVPILPTFHKDDILNIIDHSDSKVVFVGAEHEAYLSLGAMPNVEATIDILHLSPIVSLTRSDRGLSVDAQALYDSRYPKGLDRDELSFASVSNNEVMVLNYTSGTTGYSKGVLITANNLAANMIFAHRQNIFNTASRVLCFLPNAHAYSCAFNFLAPLTIGCHVYILGHKPVGSILLKAFKAVKPTLLFSVPLILEKIYKSTIQPKLQSPVMKAMLATPGLRNIVYKKVGKSLLEAMGGELELFVVGGAALNEEVDRFLSNTNFPYTVGYGMTECAPIISFAKPKNFVPTSCGKRLDKDLCEIRIFEPTLKDGVELGEVQVKGEVACKGYYKNAEATEALFTADGWLRTGDLGYVDKKHNLFLKGRSKALLLTSSGENIHPEQIEAKIAMLPYFVEAVLVQRDQHKLVAIVTIDKKALAKDGKELSAILEENRKALNKQVASFEQVSAFEVLEGDFEKTPKQSIKRYLYS